MRSQIRPMLEFIRIRFVLTLAIAGLFSAPSFSERMDSLAGQRTTLTPAVAVQLIAAGLRKPYVGSSVFFDSSGKFLEDPSMNLASFLMKHGMIACSKTAEGEPDFPTCHLTAKGRSSPHFGAVRSSGRTDYYIRCFDDRSPKLIVQRINDPSAVQFRFTRFPNALGSAVFGKKPDKIEATAEFKFKNGHWTLAGINGMPGD